MTSSAQDLQRTATLPRVAAQPDQPVIETVAVVQAPAVPTSTPWAATSLLLLALLLLGFVATTTGLSQVVHARAQALSYAELREQLANGTAPVGGLDELGRPVPVGAPVALLELDALGLREVVVEGTSSGVLREGPGHRRDSVLPGQAGTAVVFGRRAAFGGPFADLGELRRGSEIDVTTGQGRFTYRVVGTRRGGGATPAPLPAGGGRLTLVTATGLPYLPEEVLRVDADLVGTPAPTPPRAAVPLTRAESALAGDRSSLTSLLLWTQALLLAACGAALLRARWGLRQTWVVAVPVLIVLGVAVSASAVQLLPNLL
jgi:LPXTG-site transpeptidase (sortase) family protein